MIVYNIVEDFSCVASILIVVI